MPGTAAALAPQSRSSGLFVQREERTALAEGSCVPGNWAQRKASGRPRRTQSAHFLPKQRLGLCVRLLPPGVGFFQEALCPPTNASLICSTISSLARLDSNDQHNLGSN